MRQVLFSVVVILAMLSGCAIGPVWITPMDALRAFGPDPDIKSERTECLSVIRIDSAEHFSPSDRTVVFEYKQGNTVLNYLIKEEDAQFYVVGKKYTVKIRRREGPAEYMNVPIHAKLKPQGRGVWHIPIDCN